MSRLYALRVGVSSAVVCMSRLYTVRVGRVSSCDDCILRLYVDGFLVSVCSSSFSCSCLYHDIVPWMELILSGVCLSEKIHRTLCINSTECTICYIVIYTIETKQYQNNHFYIFQCTEHNIQRKKESTLKNITNSC